MADALLHPFMEAAGEIDAAFNGYAEAAGLPVDKFRYVVCLLMAFPLAALTREIPRKYLQLRYTVDIFLGSLFGWFCFREEVAHPVFTMCVTYLLACYTSGKFRAYSIFTFNILYIFGCHVRVLMNDYGGYKLDFTGAQMVLTIKLTQFGFNLLDGDRIKNSDKTLAESQKQWAVREVPSPLVFFGYCFYFPAFLAGPAYEFTDYVKFHTGTLFEKKTGAKGTESGLDEPTRLGATLHAMKKLVIGLVCGGLLQMASKYPVRWMVCKDYSTGAIKDNCTADGLMNVDYLALPWIQRYLYIWIACCLCRYSYYFAWTLADGACTMSTFGYLNEKKGYERCSNCDILNVEFGQSIREVMSAWNKGTNHWLRYYGYDRLQEAGVPKHLATHGAFFLSAFWHGLYPGYYMTFIIAAFATNCARALRKWLRPKFEDPKTKSTPFWYNLGGVLMTTTTMGHCGSPFVVLDGAQGWAIWKSVNFVGPASVLGMYVLASAMAPSRKKKKA